MSILLVSEIFPPQVGGSGRWLYEVYRRMPAGSVLVAAGEHAHAAEFDALNDLSIHRLPLHLDAWGVFGFAGLRNYWNYANRLLQLVRKNGITELHVARCLPEGFAAWWLWFFHGVPYVVYVHGEETRTSAQSREYKWMTHRVYRNARYLIANSANTARVLREEWQVPESRIQVLHPGVNANRYTPVPRDEPARCRLGWQGKEVVLTAGRLQIRKGHDMLIRALPAIRQRVPNVLYAIVGDGEERSRLTALAAELNVTDSVQFLGEVNEDMLLTCFQQCDLFVLPNREVNGDFEGFGIVLLEAQACGKPVIAGNSGGTRETMAVPRTGMIIPCETPEPLANAIAELLLDTVQREQMGVAGRDWIVNHFDWTSLSHQAANIFGINLNQIDHRSTNQSTVGSHS